MVVFKVEKLPFKKEAEVSVAQHTQLSVSVQQGGTAALKLEEIAWDRQEHHCKGF